MAKIVKQISSLEKVRRNSTMNYDEVKSKTLLKGERFSYQIAFRTDDTVNGRVEVESELKDYIKLYYIENAVMDTPITVTEGALDIDYITTEPGLMPDILVPLKEHNDIWVTRIGAAAIWVELNLPEDIKPGKYGITVKLAYMKDVNLKRDEGYAFEKHMEIEVIDEKIPVQNLIYTRWIYLDCIADYYDVEVYSDEHFALIEKYIQQAEDVGVNMILVPIHTPPLDTGIGLRRTCVQLVDITKDGDKYTFGFEKFEKFINLCKKHGIGYFEMAHMFSQWGAKCAPNIMVEENGVKDYMFGWHVASDSVEYQEFLKQYIPAIVAELKREGIADKTYFHISDEPTLENLDAYKKAYNAIKPLIGDCKTFDALSNYDFYEEGLVECPVTSVDHIEEFLEHNIENQWVYYCCGPQTKYTNSFMALASSRVRILGFLIYKYGIKGFLHWGLNYYNSRISQYHVNPYATTSCHGAFPSGDPFILYPSKDDAYNSIRGKVTCEAINDINICRALEKYISKEEVVKIIDLKAGEELTFSNYPRGKDFIEDLRDELVKMIKEKCN